MGKFLKQTHRPLPFFELFIENDFTHGKAKKHNKKRYFRGF